MTARHLPLDEGRDAQRQLVTEAQPATEDAVVAVALIDDGAGGGAVLIERAARFALGCEDRAAETAVERRRPGEVVDPGPIVDAGGEVRVGDALLRIGVVAGKPDVPAGLEVDAPGSIDGA